MVGAEVRFNQLLGLAWGDLPMCSLRAADPSVSVDLDFPNEGPGRGLGGLVGHGGTLGRGDSRPNLPTFEDKIRLPIHRRYRFVLLTDDQVFGTDVRRWTTSLAAGTAMRASIDPPIN